MQECPLLLYSYVNATEEEAQILFDIQGFREGPRLSYPLYSLSALPWIPLPPWSLHTHTALGFSPCPQGTAFAFAFSVLPCFAWAFLIPRLAQLFNLAKSFSASKVLLKRMILWCLSQPHNQNQPPPTPASACNLSYCEMCKNKPICFCSLGTRYSSCFLS